MSAGNNPKYSICISHYNNYPTVRDALESIRRQIDSSYELVVVDNYSNDGSERVLRDYESQRRIRFLQRKCGRGKGRQIAFENSYGEYVIANMDLDDLFRPRIFELISQYHSICEGKLLWARSIDVSGFWGGENFTIAPRRLLSRLGGWRDLQWVEDWELASRAAKAGEYKWTDFQLLQSVNSHPERKHLVKKLKFRYTKYRDMLRCGRRVFSPGEQVSSGQRIAEFFARLTLPFYEQYKDPFNLDFDPYSSEYFIETDRIPEVHQRVSKTRD